MAEPREQLVFMNNHIKFLERQRCEIRPDGVAVICNDCGTINAFFVAGKGVVTGVELAVQCGCRIGGRHLARSN